MPIIIETLIISLLIQLVLFIPAFIFKTDKLTDLSYSMTFALLAIILYARSSQTFVHLILLIMLLAWSFRLGIYLFIRISKMKKDKRFDGIRESFYRFAKFWLLQGIVVWLVMLSSVFLFGNINPDWSFVSLLGLIIFLVGFVLETVADAQKYKFKSNPKNKTSFIQTGVWRYSRHPNYFGEFLIWLGIFVYSLSSALPLALWGVLSPLFIFVVLYYGTGIPMLERSYDKRFKNNMDYQEYKQTTNKFFFWFKKK